MYVNVPVVGQKVLDPLKLNLQKTVSSHVDTGLQEQPVQPLSHLSRANKQFL